MAITVIKIGGSLFTEPGAMRRVGEWLASTLTPGANRVLIAGGGAVVDGLRRFEDANPLPTAVSHRAAIRLMDANAELLAAWLPEAVGTQSLDRIARAAERGVTADWVFGPAEFLARQEPAIEGERLAVGWETTSDSIAARVAVALDASLVLLKHSLEGVYDESEGLAAAAEKGLVDTELPRFAADLADLRLLGVFDADFSGRSNPQRP